MAMKTGRRAGIWAAVLFCGLCFGLVPAFAGDNAEPVIKGAEYEVMKVVLEKYPSSTVDKTTLSGKLSANLDKWKFDPQLDKDIVGDLDEKNKRLFVITRKPFKLVVIDTDTGEIVWADEARGEDAHFKLSIAGFGGGVDNDTRMFDKVMKPVIQQLVASIKAADL